MYRFKHQSHFYARKIEEWKLRRGENTTHFEEVLDYKGERESSPKILVMRLLSSVTRGSSWDTDIQNAAASAMETGVPGARFLRHL